MEKKIVVIGMGYVGIPAAALLADVQGYRVVGLQRRSQRSGWKIDVLNSGQSPFKGKEPGLQDLIARVVEKGTFSVTDDVDTLKDADIILIDVQTPTDRQNVPQYLSLKQVSHDIGKRLNRGTLVIVESTVAPGTTEHIVQGIIEDESGMVGGEDFDLAFSYERVMPGKLIRNIVELPRVIGGITPRATERARELYSKIVKGPLRTTSVLTAELSKTIENAYRDVNIAFANEMALVCESLGVDVYEVRELVNELPSRDMHIPGAGVGGHCLPKDPWLLRHGLYEYGEWKIEPEFISLARRINNHMPVHMAYLIENALHVKGLKTRGSTVTILGVAYLEDSDDTRNTPTADLMLSLQARGADIRLHDPFVKKWEMSETRIQPDIIAASKDSDCLALVTKHAEYFDMDLDKIKSVMRTPIVVDGRNVFKTEEMVKHGFEYRCIGKVGARRT